VNPVKLLNLAFGGLILSKKIETYKLMSVPQTLNERPADLIETYKLMSVPQTLERPADFTDRPRAKAKIYSKTGSDQKN